MSRTADDFRADIAKRKPPPAYDNAPEGGAFSMAENVEIEAGRTAYASIKKTFDLWIAIGRAVVVLRAKADRIGKRTAFARLMDQQGLSMQAATSTRLLKIMAKLPAVVAWHEELSERRKFDWCSPNAIFKHCPEFKKAEVDPADKELSPMEKLKQEIVTLSEENKRMKDNGDDQRFDPKDTAKDIATTIVGMFTPSKARSIANAILAMLKEREAA